MASKINGLPVSTGGLFFNTQNSFMKITIENTSKTVTVNGVPARIWEGHTDNGIPVHCFITRIACEKDADASEFEKELKRVKQPSADIEAYPMHLVL